jgi:hypothetical protein
LERRGYRLVGVAHGRHRSEAELSFFRTWLPSRRNKRARRNAQLNGARWKLSAERTRRVRGGHRAVSRTMTDMHVAIIDYGSGNLHSAAKAFRARGARSVL